LYPAWGTPAPGRDGALYCALAMPKMKSHSGAKKRFKRTASGKLKARHAFSSHMLEHKSPKRKRAFGLDRDISKADRKVVTKLLGGKGR
jgi:large subunit ribosomal protein L35